MEEEELSQGRLLRLFRFYTGKAAVRQKLRVFEPRVPAVSQSSLCASVYRIADRWAFSGDSAQSPISQRRFFWRSFLTILQKRANIGFTN